jgi:diguanylate cyclase (GGDEF)-like protein/PAS domain S-box-containing protein
MFQGLSIFLFPSELTPATYDPIRPYFTYVAAGMLTGGVVLLMLAEYPHPRWLRRTLSVLPAGPVLILFWLLVRIHRWPGTLMYGGLSLAILVATWWPKWEPDGEGPHRLDLAALTLGLMELGVGTLALLAPGSLTGPLGRVEQYMPLLGAAGLLGGTALLLCALDSPRFNLGTAWRLPGSLLPILMVYGYATTAHWTGFLSWGTWAVVVLVGRSQLLRRWGGQAPAAPPASTSDPLPERMERVIEVWLWTAAVAVVGLTAIGGPGFVAAPAVAGVFVIFVAAYNLLAFRVVRSVGTHERRIHWHLAFMTVALGILATDNGPIGYAVLAPFLLTIPLATRAAGPLAGTRVMGLAAAVVLARTTYGWRAGLEPFGVAVAHASLQLLGILGAAAIGISSANVQRRVAMALGDTQSTLRREIQMRTLVESISSAVRGSLELPAILQTTVDQLGQAQNISRCLIRIYQDGVLDPPKHQYLAEGIAPVPADYRPSFLTRLFTACGKPVCINSVATDPRLASEGERERAYLLGLSIQAIMVAPLTAGIERIGVVEFHQCDRTRFWTAEEVHFLEAVAGEISVAISHGRAHQTLADSLGELQAAHEELQAAHEELQAREEEMAAQQEELQAQHEELIHQADHLQKQHSELEAALEEAKAAEAAKSRFAAILEATTDLVSMSDAAGRRLYMNQAGRRLIGMDDGEDIVGQDIGKVHPPAAEHILKTVAIPAAKRDGFWRGESVYLARDGREIPVSQLILAHKAADGTVSFLSNICRDMTEQKQAEEALRNSEELFRSAFDSSPLGMALLNPDGTPRQVNRALSDLLGYAEGELLSLKGIRELSYPDDRAINAELARQLRAGEIRAYTVEKRYQHKQGSIINAELSVTAVRDARNTTRYMLLQIQDVTERKQFESQLLHMANFDPLTDMYNRRRFEEALEHHLQLAKRYDSTGALLFLDLDQFKYVNDSLGHQAGDLFLKGMSAMLSQRLRKSDIIARLGGDEFAILLPNTTLEQARTVAEDIRKSVRRHSQLIAGQPVSITCSVGVAMFPEHGVTAEELLSRADLAMYQAKEHGRNRTYVSSPETETEDAGSKLTWERRIREALEADRLVLFSQPILDLKTNRVVQHELLLRMQCENGDVILPGQFLEIAERFGLIRAIDRWVVKRAIHMIAEGRRTNPDICLEVNLSGRAFDDAELLPLIEHELAATGINPHALVLEITETAAIANIETARKFIATLRGLGCRFALDDFGAGFSSFFYLKHLPVDYLKIDGNFIKNLPFDPVDQHLVKAMVEVAKGLGKQTVAEFVEHAETLDLLRQFGVDYAQGYYIGRPEPMSGS